MTSVQRELRVFLGTIYFVVWLMEIRACSILGNCCIFEPQAQPLIEGF